MTHAIRIYEHGGPEVLRWEEVQVDAPQTGEALIRQTAVGVNFIDTYHRTGLYPVELPAILGREAVGVVEAVGPDVTSVSVGDRVTYVMIPGAYTERRTIEAKHLIRIPTAIDDQTVAAILLKGLTTHYLVRRTYPLKAGETILVHAAAGGVGLILCQWAKHIGATVIGTVGSEEKAQLAREHGCDHPILYQQEDFVARVGKLTEGQGVPVVYDSVGQQTFERSLDCLKPLGLIVSFGQSSGAIPPFNLGVLAAKGSLFLTRPTLATYIAQRDDLDRAASELFALVAAGHLRVQIGQEYPLAEAVQAHVDLEARKTTGSTVLLP